jgi:hypothetical protein
MATVRSDKGATQMTYKTIHATSSFMIEYVDVSLDVAVDEAWYMEQAVFCRVRRQGGRNDLVG